MPYSRKRNANLADGREDYGLLCDGVSAGRCYQTHFGSWHWTVLQTPMLKTFGGIVAKGDCDTLENAQEAFKAAYEALRALNGCPVANPEATQPATDAPGLLWFYSAGPRQGG